MFLIQKGQPAKPICREHRVAGVCHKCAIIRQQAIEQAREHAAIASISRARTIGVIAMADEYFERFGVRIAAQS